MALAWVLRSRVERTFKSARAVALPPPACVSLYGTEACWCQNDIFFFKVVICHRAISDGGCGAVGVGWGGVRGLFVAEVFYARSAGRVTSRSNVMQRDKC